MEKLEHLILGNLVFNEEYARKVTPFINPNYFNKRVEKIVFEEATDFISNYNSLITIEALKIEIDNRTDLNENELKEIDTLVSSLTKSSLDQQWLIDTTEKWCRDKAIYLALMESIHIADGKDDKKSRDSIPSILSDALSVSFDNNVGHDYLANYLERYEFYKRKEDKIQFDIEFLNKITKGGIPRKTLNIIIAGTGVGKSLALCHFAAATLLQGKNVLYITLEMAEERIAERIDANLFNVPIQQLTELSQQMFENKVMNLSKKTHGKLIIKEYPTASAHAGHFKSLLNELALKKSFKPDIIFVDYLNICSSSRYKSNLSVNSYSYIKAIAEELRGLAVEFNVPVFSATQTTRSGYGSSDLELTDTSESFGLPATADMMLALISTEELEQLGQILIKQLKNRYNDPTIHRRFIVGIDRAKMRLYDCEQSAQTGLLEDTNGIDDEDDDGPPKKSFTGFKF